MSQVPCWVTNAYPGLKVGTAVLASDLSDHSTQPKVAVLDARGREHVVMRASLVPMLPEEIASGTADVLPCIHRERGDADLHHPNGTHRSTPASVDGRAVASHEHRLRRHLAHVKTQREG